MSKEIKGFVDNIEDYLKYLQSYLEISYDSVVHCDGDSYSSCQEEGICRCGTLENLSVNWVNIRAIINDLIESFENRKFSLNLVEKYCISRILLHSKMDDPNRWSVETENGYYGEEIGDPTFYDIDEINFALEELFKKQTDDDKIRYVLELEYGQLLSHHQSCNFKIEEVSLDDIYFDEAIKSTVSEDIVNKYDKLFFHIPDYVFIRRTHPWLLLHSLPMAIVDKKNKGGYRLRDGRHRVTAMNNRRQAIESQEMLYLTSEDEVERALGKILRKGTVKVIIAE